VFYFKKSFQAQISDDDSSSMAGGEAMPHLSDTEEEEDQFIEEDENENESVPKDKKLKRKDEMPLDLTCA
jgi:hypothetical protein